MTSRSKRLTGRLLWLLGPGRIYLGLRGVAGVKLYDTRQHFAIFSDRERGYRFGRYMLAPWPVGGICG